jgi:hypothetical protein
MKALFFLSSVLLFTTINAQNFEVVPKVPSIEAGYRIMPHTTYPLHISGPTVQIDMAWQVKGFIERSAAYISVPLGYTLFNSLGNDSTVNGSILHYGFTIRHDLSRKKKWTPFLSYSLLLNQLWIHGATGHVIGHETRFDFGYDYKPGAKKFSIILKIEYSHLTFPALGKKKSDMCEVFALKTGIRF